MKNSYLIFIVLIFSSLSIGQKVVIDLSKSDWTFNEFGRKEKYSAKVPGTFHTDLLANQLIEDPFYGTNESQLQTYNNKEWEYETYFNINKNNLEPEQIHLIFEGLDTYAQVYLNGKSLFYANNMFVKWKIPIKNHLNIGENHLKIHFFNPLKVAENLGKQLSYKLPEGERVFVRKVQHHFGWDWSPKFITAGIWQPVYIESFQNAEIKDWQYEQKHVDETKADLIFKVNINCEKEGNYELLINEKINDVYLEKGENNIELSYKVNNPKLWFIHENPHLYDFDIKLYNKKELIDNKKKKIGLRTIELIQTPDEKGSSFYFKLNGKQVFIKGANYVPQDIFLHRVTREKTFELVKQAKLANMNMLRVWGGGAYPSQDFMDACDEMGIMVWQDFMFACAMYPGDDDFLNNVKVEIDQQINRLQHHASLALWCGNNEIDEGWHNWGWQKQFNYSPADSTKIWDDYKKLFHELIPNRLNALVPKNRRIYWQSSPSKGWGRPESLLMGDVHYWGVWWGMEPFENYEKKVGRFVSEYGFQGMPSVSTFNQFTNKDDQYLNSPALKVHQKHPKGAETIETYMARDYNVPKNFEDYVYVSQLLQARGMKIAIETHRRAMPYCMGTLYWQLNDCWPVTSWSTIDYYGNWKAAHYQVKRSYEPLLISFEDVKNQINIFLINDLLKNNKGQLLISINDFQGETKWTKKLNINIDANSSKNVMTILKKDFKKWSNGNHYLKVSFENEIDTIYSMYDFEKPKNMNLQKASLTWKIIDNKTIEIQTNTFAKDIYLYAENVKFENNFFDLEPYQKLLINFEGNFKDLKIKCLNNIY